MTVIKPNCRVQFTAEDIAFIVETLGSRAGTADCLTRLLADEQSRDLILDDDELLHAVLTQRTCLRISTAFYFYILVRHTFRRSGLADRPMADYVAAVLAEFSQMQRTRCMVKGQEQPLDYFVDMLAALESVDDTTRFYIRAHIGNQSLFLSGVFPDSLRFRTERRGAPSLSFYEEIGRSNFRAASDHRLARRYELDGIFNTLAERFQETRRALNDLRDRLLSLGDPDLPELLVKPPPR
ncbi:MAG: hypothetical protein QOF48_3334 [Verrucomicrobiota bacterium]